MSGILTIAHLTLYEARRRRIMTAALLCGSGFVIVFTVAMFFANAQIVREQQPLLQRQGTLSLLTIAGLFAANFLSVLFAVLLPVDALSGEIESGVMQTLASKPLRRSEIVLGKWLAYGAIATGSSAAPVPETTNIPTVVVAVVSAGVSTASPITRRGRTLT